MCLARKFKFKYVADTGAFCFYSSQPLLPGGPLIGSKNQFRSSVIGAKDGYHDTHTCSYL